MNERLYVSTADICTAKQVTAAQLDIHDAVKIGNVQMLEAAVKSGASVNEHDTAKDHFTPLHWACYAGSLEVSSLVTVATFCARRLSVERYSYSDVAGWVAGWLAGWLGGWLSHAGTVSKRLNLSENFFDHLKAPSF